MRIVFMGTPEFAVASLRAILDAGHEVPFVVSTPDREKGRGLKLMPSAVKAFAVERGIEVATPEKLKDPAFLELLRSVDPELICVVAFRILPEEVYSIPSRGSFNLHGSLLPKYRGAAPINWAIINGERETGVTTFFLQKRVDTGAIIMQRSIPIGPETTAGELHDEMMEIGAEVVVETISRIEQGNAEPIHQDDSLATPAPKIFRDDCRIDWTGPAQRVHDFIRGLSPHPAAFTRYHGRMLKVYRSVVTEESGLAPGCMRAERDALIVGTGTTALRLIEMQQEGKRAMPAEEFLRGFKIEQGDFLGDADATG
jgi:methionyl-tRNA formyltransferase